MRRQADQIALKGIRQLAKQSPAKSQKNYFQNDTCTNNATVPKTIYEFSAKSPSPLTLENAAQRDSDAPLTDKAPKNYDDVICIMEMSKVQIKLVFFFLERVQLVHLLPLLIRTYVNSQVLPLKVRETQREMSETG